ncbi:hypothetical protein [Pedobacter soli]|uniref:YhhN-like protein n=1 Tax=Pedobacter soli TaxID=390242 RepID=A0A1G6K269_9SPHI|nr:hypothetical protein [Pedobacter soli]SDC25129.1 hypothetical protein SAMN04488024_101633 [Pedobacter soli]
MASFKDISFAVSNISDISEIFPALVWIKWGNRNKPFAMMGLFFLVSGIIRLIALGTAIKGIHNMPLYHLLALLEAAAVYIFFTQAKGTKPKTAVLVILLLVYSGNILFQNMYLDFNSNTWTLTVLIIIFLGMRFFHRIYQTEESKALQRMPEFVITCGWLIYSSGSLFTYLMGTDILSGKPEGFFNNAWLIQCVSNIIKNGIICYGFILSSTECPR